MPLDIIKFLASNPFVNITKTSQYLKVSRQTASIYLKQLANTKSGILKSVKVGRDILYFNEQFISLLSLDV